MYIIPEKKNKTSYSLCSPSLQDPTPPLRTTEHPSLPPPQAPYTWEEPTTVRCRLDPSYQVSVQRCNDIDIFYDMR